MQLPAYTAAKRKGWVSVGVDGNPEAPCRNKADYFFHIDLKDRMGIAEKATELKETIGLDGVFTCGTDFSSTVAWVAQELNLPGIPYQTSLDCTDKYRMRTKLKEHGVPCPQFREADSDSDLTTLISELSFPLVVKPVDNMGSRGVITVFDMDSLEKAVNEAVLFSRTDRAIIEEFMDGPEFSLDSLIYKGKLTITGFADRHIFFPPCFIEMGHTLPTALPEDQKEEIIRVFSDAVTALGIKNGAAKGDIKLTSKGVMIGEVAARLSGGYMSGWTYPYASGLALVEKGMMIALGMDPGDLHEPVNRTASERAFISIPGIIENIEFLEKAHSVPGVKDIFLRVEEGDSVDFPVNNVSKCGNVIAVSDTRDSALAASEKSVATIRIRLKKNTDSTRTFLEQSLQTEFPPSAYDVFLEELEEFHPDFSMKYASHPVPVPFKENELMKKDWHGISLKELMEEAEQKGVQFAGDQNWTLFAKHFWHAALRGGIQGTDWFLKENEE